jgi:hypothetical protein
MFGQNYHFRMVQRPKRSKDNSGARVSAPSAGVPLKVPCWSRFRNPAKVDAQKIRDLFALNVVNLTVPGGASQLEQVQVIATQASTPIPIAYLDPVLAETKSIRGAVFSRNLGPILNEIAVGYRDMIWFLSAEGLIMKGVEPPPVTAGLSSFDRIAGAIYVSRSSNGRLSQSDLEHIATALDEAGETLKENLQPKQWDAIAFHNQKHSRRPIKTFAAAIEDPDFARSVRRRLYVARDAYEAALKLPHKHLEKYDAHILQNSGVLY